jgi:hypothetical protein
MLLIPLIACNQNTDSKQDKKNFEGVVTYKILYDNNDDTALYGDTMRMYYSNGNFIKEYNGESPKGLKREMFISSINKYYMNIGNSDSFYNYDITKNVNTLVNSKHTQNDTAILGYSCDKVEFTQLHPNPNFYIYNSYYYSDKVLRIDPKYFEAWNYGSFNKFINEAGSFYLKFQTSIQYYGKKDLVTKIFEAVRIEEKKIDPQIFIIDSSKIERFKID